jgi:hypothetical protein
MDLLLHVVTDGGRVASDFAPVLDGLRPAR